MGQYCEKQQDQKKKIRITNLMKKWVMFLSACQTLRNNYFWGRRSGCLFRRYT